MKSAAFVSLVMFSLSSQQVLAVTETWSGVTNNSWATASNWSTTTPVNGDDLVFPNNANNFTPNNNIGAGLILNSITIDSSLANSYTISGNSITFAGSTITVNTTAGNGAHTISLPIVATAGNIITQNSTGVLTLSGIISSTGSFQKLGVGTLVLSGVNTYSGGTILDDGTLTISENANIGDITGALTMKGGTLRTTATFSLFSSPTQRPVALDAGAQTFSPDTGTTLTIPVGITGAGQLVVNGVGTVSVTNPTNSYSGGIVITTGKLSATNDSCLGNAANSVTFNAGTLQFNAGSGSNTARAMILTGNGTFQMDSGTSIFSGLISGAGSLTKTGAGILALSNAGNSFSGGVVINDGKVSLNSTTALITTSSVSLNAANTNFDILSAVGNVTIGDLSGVANSSITLGGNNLTAGGTTTPLTFAGVMSSTGGAFTKAGTGTLIFSGVNTYTGGTTITGGGALSISADNNLGGAGNLTINSSTLQSTAGVSSTRNVILAGSGGTIQTDSGTTTFATPGVISGTGPLTKTGAATLALTGVNTYTGGTVINAGTLSISDDNNLGNAAGSVTINASTLNTAGGVSSVRNFILSGGGGTFQTDSGTTTISGPGVISGVGASLTKTGTGTLTLAGSNTYSGGTFVNVGTLNLTSTTALLSTGAVDINANTTGVLNISSAGGNVTIGALSGTAGIGQTPPASIILGANSLTSSSSSSTTYAGVMSGTGGFIKAGSGTLTFTGSSSYTGGTTINAGTLSVPKNASLGNTAGTLDFGGGTLQITAAFNASRNGTIGAGGGTIQTDAGSSNFSGVFGGAGGLTKTGAATLVLSGTNTYLGGTTINAGTLSVSSNGNLGDATGSLNFGGGTLQLTAAVSNSRSGTIAGGGGTIQTDAGSSNFSGVFGGAGALTKTGTATLVLSGVNTYSGGTAINAGILSISNDNNLGNAAGPLSISGSTLDCTAAVTSSRTVALAGGSTIQTDAGTSTFSGVFGGTGGLTKTGTATLVLSGVNTYTEGTTVSAGTLSISNDNNLGNAAGSLSISGSTLDCTAAVTSSRTVSLAGGSTIQTDAGTTTFSGVFGGTGGLTKTGTATLVLSGVNTYTGSTTINAGILSISNDNNLGDAAGSLSINGSTLATTGTVTSARTVSLAGGSTFQIGANGTFSGVFGGTGGLIKTGAATLALSGVNTYTGGTAINAGTLSISADNNLGGSGSVTINASTLQFTGNVGSTRDFILSGGGGTFQTDSGTTSTLSGPGVISGVGASLTKTGSGTLVLAGTNTYSGSTFVNAGRLAVNGSIFSNTTVAAGATLGGTGTITGTVTNNGTVAPGNSIGQLNIVGSYIQAAGSIFNVEINPAPGQTDLLSVTGAPGTITINPGATLLVQPASGTYPVNATPYTIMTATGGVSGTFTTVTFTPNIFTSNVIYNANSVQLFVTGTDLVGLLPTSSASASFSSGCGNPRVVATTLDDISDPNSDLQTIIMALGTLSGNAFVDALNQLQPSLFKGATFVAQEQAVTNVRTMISSRLETVVNQRAQDARCDTGVNQGWNLWGQVFRDWAQQDIQRCQRGYNAQTGGLVIGSDKQVIDGLTLGLTAAYTYTDLQFMKKKGNTKIQGAYGGVYGDYYRAHFFLEATVLGIWNGYSGHRKIHFDTISRTASHENSAAGFNGHLGMGFVIKANRLNIMPFVAGDYYYSHERGYHDHGAHSANLHVKSSTMKMVRSELGIDWSLAYSCDARSQWIPHVKGSWVREVRLEGSKYTAKFVNTDISMKVKGLAPDRSMLDVAAGVTFFITKQAYMDFAYEGEFDFNYYNDQQVRLQASYTF